MKMFPSRRAPAFVTATTMLRLSLTIMFCALVTSVSAAPQFGRPLLHALDESPAGLASSLTVDPSAPSLPGLSPTVLFLGTPGANHDPSEIPRAGGTTQMPELDVDSVDVAIPSGSPTAVLITSSTVTPTLVQTNTNTNTNGARYRSGGVHVATVLSVAASAVVVFFIF